MRFAKSKLLNTAALREAQKSGEPLLPFLKTALSKAKEQLNKYQSEGVAAAELVAKHTWVMDQVVIAAWHHHYAKAKLKRKIELVAVGGYGRFELQPCSDIDLLLLTDTEDYDSLQEFVGDFIRFLWDLGLDIGHSVRSIKDCLKEAKADLNTITNLLESRHLAGDQTLLDILDEKLRAPRFWPANKFFNSKVEEQINRHASYQDTAYALEPNIKESPGGLRDIQTILWVYNRRYGITTFKEMLDEGFMNEEEHRALIRARNILWKMRNGLHLATGRHEDRLLFDNQRKLAQDFGYQDTDTHLAVEQLMKRYYRTVKTVMYLNEILLSYYRIRNTKAPLLSQGKKIDDEFELRNKLIAIKDDTLFSRQPSALLKLFVLMLKHNITHIHPDTIRAIRANLDLITATFRDDKNNKQQFIQLFQTEGALITNTLAKMNAYGVLGAYLPAFGAIVGQMQHDLFHVYTVDGHTLMVIRNINHLRKYPDRFPFASDIFNRLYKPERLFLAALFHDIAKGRGGDHSELGAQDAYEFCIEHDLNEYDARLVSWLVDKHLVMSHFSQRRDINDPQVIKEFADIVGDQEHLDNLYLLTFADIRGTSPQVWNAWKGQLLKDLYEATRNAVRQGVSKPIDESVHVAEDKRSALTLLAEQGIDTTYIDDFWATLPSEYFIRNEPYYVAWHAGKICESSVASLPIVSIRYSQRLEANMLFVYAPESTELLTRVTSALDETEFNIIEARLQNTNNGFVLYSFNVLPSETKLAKKRQFMSGMETSLRNIILHEKGGMIRRSKASRALKHFPIQTNVRFTFNNPNYTVMEVLAQDQPGLLNNVAYILEKNNIKLVNAKVATFGERVEDVFFIQKQNGKPVTSEKKLARLEKKICTTLNRNSSTRQKNISKTA